MKFQSGQFLTALALCLGTVGLSAAGCELIASVDRQLIDQGGMGGAGIGGSGGSEMTGGTGGTGGGMGGSGGSGGMPCMTVADCPPPANECVNATCLNGMCDTMDVPQSTPTPTQTDGDCMVNQCTGAGMVETIEDSSDPADDTKECTADTCQPDGTTTHTPPNPLPGEPLPACSENGGKVCSKQGNCVECNVDQDCTGAGEICQGEKCVLLACANAMMDGAETDIDCGGPDCNKCGTNKNCLIASDCVSSVCTGNKCQVATCSDSTKNGSETDIDCGGANCPPCANAKVCVGPSDCLSGVCAGNVCQAPTCVDGVKNGSETDVDCGGANCSACADTKTCSVNSDCMSGNCNAGICEPAGMGGAGGGGGMGGMGGMGGAGGN